MRALLKRIVYAALALVLALLFFGRIHAESPWTSVALVVMLLAAISILFTLTAMLQIGLTLIGIACTKTEVMMHLCAGLMLMLAIFAGFVDDEPRLDGAGRWVLLVALPGSVYLYAWLHEGLERCFDGRSD